MPQLRKLQWWRRTGRGGLQAVLRLYARDTGVAQVRRMQVHAHCVNAAEESSSVFAWRGTAWLHNTFVADEGKYPFRSLSCFLLNPSYALLSILAAPRARMRARPAAYFLDPVRARSSDRAIVEILDIPIGAGADRSRDLQITKHGPPTRIKWFSHDGNGARADVVGK